MVAGGGRSNWGPAVPTFWRTMQMRVELAGSDVVASANRGLTDGRAWREDTLNLGPKIRVGKVGGGSSHVTTPTISTSPDLRTYLSF